MQRREILLSIAAVLGVVVEGCVVRAHPRRGHGPHARRVRRRVRRRIRRRWRRRVAWRAVTGRRVLVVPVAAVVGWELAIDSRVVVVREVRPTTIVVVDVNGGAPEEIEVAREDTPENAVEMQGSVMPAGDASPAREGEEEVEEEVPE
jgi:hypothetical protein